MIATEHTQSLSEFRETAAATIERLNQTGEVEILTVDGEARAVLLSPAVYETMAREAEITRDIAAIRRSRQQIAEGKVHDLETAFADIRKETLAKKGTRDAVV